MAIAPVIKSISPDTGTVGDGITDVNELMLVGTAGANSTVNVFDGTTLLGATTANSSGAWAFEAKALSNGAHSFTATSADATGTSPVSAPMGVTVVPNITSFSGANGSSITIDGMSAGVNNANQPWSLTEPDNHTLRFEVRVGDYWSTSGWSDLINDGGAGRSEIGLSPTYAPGTQVNVSYQLTVEPGAANTADWLLLNQMHATTQGPPPFAVEMDGEHMQVVLRYQKPGQTSATEVVAWRDPNPIQRGHSYDMNIQVNFDPNGNGYLNVWRDGAQIVKYQGAIGMAGASYYWKEGIYRSHTASETMAADYSNLNITTGAATAPTTPTQPTTPNVTPTVIQASASPGTGIEHAGDSITLTLGFSEAVTVTGTPTLSLNDGNTATYVGGSGTSALTFKTTVASTDTNTSALAITGVNLPSGASIKDAGGLAANLSGAVKTFAGLQIDPILPAVAQATASPGTGIEHAGDSITLTLGFSEAVTVTGTPTLSLNDGNTATYVGGSGTSALTFKTTVASTDTNTSALAITGVNLPSGASIKDTSGVAANLSGAVKTFTGLQIDPVLPAVTQATASPGTGTEHVGDTITLTLGFNEAVTVSGTPMLSLNDGNTATYVGGSGTSALTFKTTVASTDTNTSALAITGVNLPSGASIKDTSGVAANLAGAVKTFTGLQISTSSSPTTPTTGTITSFSGANGSSITIDEMSAGVQNANQPWSLTEPDNHTLRFEVRVGDHWSTSGWSDLINDGGTERSEIGLSPTYAPGTQVNVSYQLTVEPGAANTADWLLLDQMHASTQGSPPFAVEMDGEHMQVVLRYQKPGQTSATEVVAWRDPNPIQRGHAYAMNIQVNFDPNGNGYLNVWRDGVQIVKYQGAIGMAGASYYWKEGIYRSHTASETMAADYSNLNITTGAAAAPTTLTQLTTATTPITPNVAATTSSTTPATPTTSTADTTPSTTSTPSVTRPDLTIADDSLWVAGRGGKVDLGVTVKTTDPNDLVTVNITGLPRYETITDKLDGRTFRGNNMTLTAAQVDSGLVLQSNYRGGGHPVATLTLTANAKDPVTGAVTSAAPKTITVTDPRPAATTSPQTNHHHTNHHHTSASTVAATAPQPITAMDHLPAVAAGAGVLANRGFAQLQQHMGLGTSTLAATAPQAITLADHLPAAGTATASLASQSFALLNQYLAGNSGRVDPGQIVAAVSQAAGRGQETFLTRPQH